MRTRNAGACGFILGTLLAVSACSGDDDDDSGGSGNNAGESAGSAGLSAGGGGKAGGNGGKAGGDGGKAGGSGKAGSGGTSAGGAGASGSGGKAEGAAGEDASGTGGTSAGTGGLGGPAPGPEWLNATGNLANMPSECGNLTLLSAVPDADTIIAGVAKAGLFASDDSGAHWNQLGTGAGSDEIVNRPSSIVYDPEHPGTFWESGIYNSGGVYKTTDGGDTFVQLGDVTHNDLVSIDFTDPERQTLLVGGHEQKQKLYLSTDGGESFEEIGANLPADSHF